MTRHGHRSGVSRAQCRHVRAVSPARVGSTVACSAVVLRKDDVELGVDRGAVGERYGKVDLAGDHADESALTLIRARLGPVRGAEEADEVRHGGRIAVDRDLPKPDRTVPLPPRDNIREVLLVGHPITLRVMTTGQALEAQHFGPDATPRNRVTKPAIAPWRRTGLHVMGTSRALVGCRYVQRWW